MKYNKTTAIELVNELTLRNTSGNYDTIIERAKNNGYHDFKHDQNPLYDDCICPKTKLVEDLEKFPELNDIRLSVMNGDFDESPDEEDNEIMLGWLLKDGEKGQKMADILGLNKK